MYHLQLPANVSSKITNASVERINRRLTILHENLKYHYGNCDVIGNPLTDLFFNVPPFNARNWNVTSQFNISHHIRIPKALKYGFTQEMKPITFSRILIAELWTGILLSLRINYTVSDLLNYHRINFNPETKQHDMKWQPAKYKIMVQSVYRTAMFDSLSLPERLTHSKQWGVLKSTQYKELK